jgi:hypothetical protein
MRNSRPWFFYNLSPLISNVSLQPSKCITLRRWSACNRFTLLIVVTHKHWLSWLEFFTLILTVATLSAHNQSMKIPNLDLITIKFDPDLISFKSKPDPVQYSARSCSISNMDLILHTNLNQIPLESRIDPVQIPTSSCSNLIKKSRNDAIVIISKLIILFKS